ncbi:CDCA3 protein, partial [Aegotheles bennettii]|nr:CDCA3 protein [Aegotheles bennettii]
MGVSGSAPVTTPTARNKHLAHISDPRSPSAGILRTPIEVLSSPVGTPQAEQPVGTSQGEDPRSPTPGISRTPMRAASGDSVECLVKQLSEAFGAEPAEEPAARRSSPVLPARPAGPGLPSGKCWGLGGIQDPCDRLVCPLLSPGSKPVRRKATSKVMATPSGTGRSPLSILQDDNSPSSPAPRQGKRPVLGENLGEKKEVMVDLNRSLKAGNCAWSDLNKENQRCPLVEN